jgi:NTP pyrophosphatase (non-canonical NTP hydrolase)
MNSHLLDVAAVQHAFRERAKSKGWQAYHTPKNLAAAVSVEAAELLEIFQWLTDEEVQAVVQNPHVKEQVADEVADIVMYLTELCARLEINLVDAITQKIDKNTRKA